MGVASRPSEQDTAESRHDNDAKIVVCALDTTTSWQWVFDLVREQIYPKFTSLLL